MKILAICLMSAALIAPALADSAAAQSIKPEQIETQLQCGDANLAARTQWFIFPAKKRVMWTAQSMTLTTPKGRIALHLEEKPLTQPFYPQQAVLDAVVISWACVPTHVGQPYIYLLYACTPSKLRPQCTPDEAGNRDVVLDTTGKKINRNEYRKRGLEQALAGPLALKSVVD